MNLRVLSNWESELPHPVTPLLDRAAAAAAMLVIAIGVATLIKPTTAPTLPAIAIADPAGEVPVPVLQTAQGGQQNTITPTEPISVAILPPGIDSGQARTQPPST